MVEALTIVLAVGVTRGWRSTLLGVVGAITTLGALVLIFGPSIAKLPISDLRLVIGALLLIFGLQWLRKSILRASGYKALHDEDKIFAREQEAARAAGAIGARPRRVDWYSFTVAFKGVLLEGLEVAFIVVTFGGSQHEIGLAAIGASAAALSVLVAGLLLHRPLSRVPENSLKFTVGLLLTSFGTFWAAEGAGVHWPGSDGALIGLLAITTSVSAVFVMVLRRRFRTQPIPA
jgi:uncharacterized membrane protein